MAKTPANHLRAIRAWQAANRGKVKQYQADYEARHKAERQKAKHDWYMANRSKMRKYPHLSGQEGKEIGLAQLRAERKGSRKAK